LQRYDKKDIATEIETTRASFNFPNLSSPNDINKIIGIITKEDLTKVPVEELLDYSTKIVVYSLYLTHETNRIKAKADWIESQIRHIVGKELANSRGFTFEEKNIDIRANHDHASEFEQEKVLELTKYEVFKNIAYKMQNLAEQLNMVIRERNNFNRKNNI
jgi:hypothetical protein